MPWDPHLEAGGDSVLEALSRKASKRRRSQARDPRRLPAAAPRCPDAPVSAAADWGTTGCVDVDPLLRVLIAAALGVPVGLDREFRGKSAGLRTHAVVAAACAALGAVSVLAAPQSATGADGTRIAAQVVSGIGFIGAGVIFASQGRARGLTTAASLFSAAAVGLCAGLGQEALAAVLTVVTLVFLWPVNALAGRLMRDVVHGEHRFQVIAQNLAALSRAQRALRDLDAPVRETSLTPFGDAVAASLLVRCRRAVADEAIDHLGAVDGIDFVSDESFAHEAGD